MKIQTILFKVFLPIAVVALAALVMVGLIKSRSAPKKVKSRETSVLVQTMQAALVKRNAVVRGTATVSPAREVTVIPQVSGMVVSVAENFTAGGFFNQGDLLFKIDDTDYRLVVQQAQAALAKAEVDIETIKSRAKIARQEWQSMQQAEGGEPAPLVLYEPQLKQAEAAFQSAMAVVKLANLNLYRTEVRAPFDLRVRSEDIDTGQFLRSGTPVAVLVGTREAEVRVPLLLEDLSWIDIPGPGRTRPGSKALVTTRGNRTASNGMTVNSGEGATSRQGQVVRSVGEVDAKTRMVKLAIVVKDPYSLERGNRGKVRLLFGAFVDVRIFGRALGEVFVVPRLALRDNSTLWLMDDEGKLKVTAVKVIRIEGEEVLVGGGLKAGDRVVLTNISGAADGMKLREMKEETAQ